MKYTKPLLIASLLICQLSVSAQTNSAAIQTSGWYRIAVNGPMVQGSTGGSRAAARFILRDITSSLHQTVEFLAYVHYGSKPSVSVLNNTYYRNGVPPFSKIRIVKGGTYEGAAIEVYLNVLGSNPNKEAYFLQDNDQVSGWTAVNWQPVSNTSGDQDGVPTGFTGYVIDLQDLAKGYVTDKGQQKSFFNGNLYTSGNILIGKMTQSNPDYKLDVNGNIRANKVVVNTTGADYVFDSAYRLITIDSLRRFITTNHHLPDIKSAGELRISGSDIGTMQELQLQKIEELTLYLIQEDEEIGELKQRIGELEQKLNEFLEDRRR